MIQQFCFEESPLLSERIFRKEHLLREENSSVRPLHSYKKSPEKGPFKICGSLKPGKFCVK